MIKMADLLPVLVPLVNPNENESLLAQLAVKEGQPIKAGELLAVFETTKATFDLRAEKDGFVRGITAQEGDLLKTGDRLCYLVERKDQPLPMDHPAKQKTEVQSPASDLRATQPALTFAREHNLDLSTFPAGQLITEKMVKDRVTANSTVVDPVSLIIYGGGGHAKSLIDLIRG